VGIPAAVCFAFCSMSFFWPSISLSSFFVLRFGDGSEISLGRRGGIGCWVGCPHRWGFVLLIILFVTLNGVRGRLAH
jgi:hypothetical protein